MYMPTMVETPPDGMQSGYHGRVSPVLFVWLFPALFLLIGGAMVAGAIGVILVAVGLAGAASLALLAGSVDGL